MKERRTFLRILLAVLACLFSAPRLFAAAVTTAPARIVEPLENPTWVVSSKGTAVYVNDPKSLDPPQLVLSALHVGDSGVNLHINSDAATLRIEDGATTLEMKTSGKKTDDLFLSLDDSDGRVILNGTEIPQVEGQWLRILTEKKGPIRIEFPAATYVKCRFGFAPEPSRTPSPPPSIRALPIGPMPPNPRAKHAPPIRASSTAPSPTAVNLQDVLKSVVELRMKHSAYDVLTSGPGFLVNKDGFIVTTFHLVHGASSGVAHFANDKNQFPVEFYAADPGLDLAVLRVEDHPAPFTSCLSLAHAPPPLGTAVWAIGYPDSGLTVTHGTVTKTPDTAAIPQKFANALGYSHDSTWLQTDCPLTHGNFGGPLVSSAGEVVGINAWSDPEPPPGTPPKKPNASFALNALQIKKLLDALPPRPLPFATAARRYDDAGVSTASFPTIIVTRDNPSAEIIDRLATLSQAMRCPKCNGTGEMLVTVVTSKPKGPFAQPTFHVEPRSCDACNGRGYNAVVFARQVAQFADTLARANPQDPLYASHMKDAVARIWSIAARYPTAFTALDFPSAWNAKKEHISRGLPIVGVGEFVRATTGNTHEPALQMVQQGGLAFLLNHPAYCDARKKDHVLFGGLLAGGFTNDDGNIVPVLQDGFIFSEANAPGHTPPK